MSLPRFPVDQFMVDLARRVFGTPDGRMMFDIIQRELGHYSADPGNDLERGQREYSLRLWRMCGIMHPKNTAEITSALFDHVVPRWGDPNIGEKQ